MTADNKQALCQLCGEPMPPGEEMFNYHGYSGNCPKPPLPKPDTPDWKPSEEMKSAVDEAFWDFEVYKERPEDGEAWANILIAVRPLIIAEVQPQIEAAERERIARAMELNHHHNCARMVRGSIGSRVIKDNKP